MILLLVVSQFGKPSQYVDLCDSVYVFEQALETGSPLFHAVNVLPPPVLIESGFVTKIRGSHGRNSNVSCLEKDEGTGSNLAYPIRNDPDALGLCGLYS